MQETWLWSLILEDPTCCRATKHMCHNYWNCALKTGSCNCWTHVPRLLKLKGLELMLYNERSHCGGELMCCNKRVAPAATTKEKPAKQQRPSTTKNIYINNFFKVSLVNHGSITLRTKFHHCQESRFNFLYVYFIRI